MPTYLLEMYSRSPRTWSSEDLALVDRRVEHFAAVDLQLPAGAG